METIKQIWERKIIQIWERKTKNKIKQVQLTGYNTLNTEHKTEAASKQLQIPQREEVVRSWVEFSATP